MPLIKTTEELLASKIKPRNPFAALSSIYFLRKRQNADYFPSAPNRIVWGSSNIGTGTGTSKTFTALAQSSYSKGDSITLEGTATYVITSGATSILKPTIKIVAQIDIAKNGSGFQPIQIDALASTEINGDGTFSFTIPSEITAQMVAGEHTVYLDAFSPIGPTRLDVDGINDGVQTFVIT